MKELVSLPGKEYHVEILLLGNQAKGRYHMRTFFTASLQCPFSERTMYMQSAIDALPQVPSSLNPFFHAELPLTAPGINESYMPGMENEKYTLIHTPAARQFLLQATWYFRDQTNIKKFDRRVFEAISESREKVPFDVTLKLHLKTLWQRDIDGPDKIILDALFEHFVFLADSGYARNWNDNRVVALH